MNTQTDSETWQVDVNGEIYQADFAELTTWVQEGALLSADKVRRGNLRWIEAGKVPVLTSFFNAKASGEPPPQISVTETKVPVEETPVPISETFSNLQPVEPAPPPMVQDVSRQDPDKCAIHSEAPSFYICVSCNGSFCKTCPSSYGGSVRICPSCGGLCKAKSEIKQAQHAQTTYANAVSGGFGFSDFAEALSYPLRFKTSLFFGALMFMFFTLGQSAAALGGIFMIVASIFCFMLANMLTFGVLANTVENFAQGKIGGNFMPSFDEFSIWDDVLHPFFLSLGAYISSFGGFVLVVVIGMYFVFNSMTSQSQAMQSEIEKIPGTNYYDTGRTMQQSQQVKGLLGNTTEQNEQRLKLQEQIENDGTAAAANPEDTEASVQRANELIQKTQKAQLESTFGKTPETRQRENEAMIKRFLSLAAPLVVLAAILFLWGAFYFPAACAVAGYTRSFTATVNPLVGLDTIKRLGFDYVKILLMGLTIGVMSVIIGALLGTIFAPFDLPGFANLPAKAVGAVFGFYFSVVFSCVIGLALYKASDRLKLHS